MPAWLSARCSGPAADLLQHPFTLFVTAIFFVWLSPTASEMDAATALLDWFMLEVIENG